MSKRKTRHLKALRLGGLNEVLIVNTETNEYAWYADYGSYYLKSGDITWSSWLRGDVTKYYKKLVAEGATAICL